MMISFQYDEDRMMRKKLRGLWLKGRRGGVSAGVGCYQRAFTIAIAMFTIKIIIKITYLIFVIFSPRQFLAHFSPRKSAKIVPKQISRQNSVNPKQTDFAERYCKMRQNTINCTHYFSTFQIFFTFLMWRIFST